MPIRSGGEPPLERGGGTGRNALPSYDFPAYLVTNHLLTEMPLRTSALRSLGAFLNVFAAESFMDELASAAGRDPLEFRLAHLSDPRGQAVLHTAASQAGWAEWTSREAVGHGIGGGPDLIADPWLGSVPVAVGGFALLARDPRPRMLPRCRHVPARGAGLGSDGGVRPGDRERPG